MTRTAIAIIIALCLQPSVFAQVPNKLPVVEKVAAADRARFACAHTPAACGFDFIKALACELHQADPRFGLTGKRGDPRAMSWDALTFCGGGPATDPTGACAGTLTIIDVIAAAGGPGARPVWQAFSGDPTPGAWIQPVCKPEPIPPGPSPCPPTKPCPPPPTPKPYPGDRFFIEQIGQILEWDYDEAGQMLNGGAAVWFARPIWGYVNEGLTIDQAIARARKEWRTALGLKP